MKQYKSPGLDGILNEFYQIYWDTIKEDLFEVLLEIFDKFEICDSQCRIDLRKNVSVHLVSRRYHILNYHLDP
jgi:hypothetical protein